MPQVKKADADKHIHGNMRGEDPKVRAAFLEDPFGAGAAMVLAKGLPLTQVTAEEACRFKLAFLNVFLALGPAVFDNVLEARRQTIAEGGLGDLATDAASTDHRDGRPRDLPPWSPDLMLVD